MKNFCFFRILILAVAASASVCSAIAKEEGEPFLLTVKNTESGHRDRGNTDVNVGEGEANGFLLAASASGAGEDEDRLLSVPFKNAKTETSNLGHRRTTVGEADKAGKASPPNSDEVGGLKRKREHECDMYQFEGEFVYQAGCDGNPWKISITCDKKGRKEERRSGLICTYYDEDLVSVLFV
jgi:hypothetical protein